MDCRWDGHEGPQRGWINQKHIYPHPGTFVSILYESTCRNAPISPGGRNSSCWPRVSPQHDLAVRPARHSLAVLKPAHVQGTSSVVASVILSFPSRQAGCGYARTLPCHPEAESLTRGDHKRCQAEGSVPVLPTLGAARRILRCGSPRRSLSRQPELCTAVRMTTSQQAGGEFLGSGYTSRPRRGETLAKDPSRCPRKGPLLLH
jgi:hypothetical protein